MANLTDAEILAALPAETKQKINNSFESLAQASPSPEEQATLYRIAHTLKLNPTDTVFSIMSAMHFYLQLYNLIPKKITESAGEIQLAGEDVDKRIRKATKETLTEHAGALKAQAALVMTQTQHGLADEVVQLAQQIAGDMAVDAQQKSFYIAAGVLTVFAGVFFGSGMALGQHDFGWILLSAMSIGIGVISGMLLCQAMIASEQTKTRKNESQRKIAATHAAFSEADFQRVATTVQPPLGEQMRTACRDVLFGGMDADAAASKNGFRGGEVAIAVAQLKINRQKLS